MSSKYYDRFSIVIPAGNTITSKVEQLKEELSNGYMQIVDEEHRNSWYDSLSQAIAGLEAYSSRPVNGLIVYSGKGFLQVFEPYKPTKLNLYRCDKEFVRFPDE